MNNSDFNSLRNAGEQGRMRNRLGSTPGYDAPDVDEEMRIRAAQKASGVRKRPVWPYLVFGVAILAIALSQIT